ncbi:vacuolar carboxypeptidase-like protein Cps1 [Delitschia confertaspora ATCC 74209]|uniref:Vacuolar carboxypeptidase-like protein Cps1 n=1 Tax=Delitschia confertaspora ATCC 74209 TaxID=1513339 RepID=A0A9P4JPU3_9PLEO|nr:vacuolar carboxypeptidase-like protein Cps1 [Delitschia confertaspora ATCC 74209]
MKTSIALGTSLLLGGLWLSFHNSRQHHQWTPTSPSISEPKCPQVSATFPSRETEALNAMDEFLKSSKFFNQSVERLSAAVQIPTESFDDMGLVGEDPRWKIFFDFEAYLKATFPLVHSTLKVDKVNTHGLLYSWAGSDPSLKPTLLMAHQDVVPVPEATVKQWTHPPFSGFYDGKYVWGRGSSDCKNQLIAILEAVEELIAAKFEPKRGLILSFGFDEEISGPQGAAHLASYILEKHGKNSIAAIVDEGAGTFNVWGAKFAMPGVGEKGYTDIQIVVRMPGGHSSIPPAHNGIGVAAELVTLIEGHPYEPRLDDANPYLGLMHCGAEHAPEFPHKLKKLLNNRSSSHKQCGKDELALEAAKAGSDVKYLMTTSVAVDIIQGGVKVNALPERTVITVNHRVNVGSRTSDVEKKITKLASHVAHKYNLTLNAFEGEESPSSITLTSTKNKLEPAPVTPTEVGNGSPYEILSGTTRALYGEDMLVAPGIMTGNTDTKHYWPLTEHIFRYGPGFDPEQEGFGKIHTVDEAQSVKAHIATVRWFSLFIRNMDEANL